MRMDRKKNFELVFQETFACNSCPNPSINMKKIIALLFTIVPTIIWAQQSIECQIMRQRIMEQVNAPNQCQSMYQQCMLNARHAPNFNIAQSQCQIQLGGCQMGGAVGNALGAEQQMQQSIQQYKSMCER